MDALAYKKERTTTVLSSRCRTCERTWFPPLRICPRCSSEDLSPVKLSGRGTLYTYTVVYVGRGDLPTPYAVGMVDLEQEVRVFGQIDSWEDGLHVGDAMEALWGPIRRLPDGTLLEGYRFRPCSRAPEAVS